MKKRARIILWTLFCLLGSVILFGAGVWVYADSWRWRFCDLAFHESWSPEERAAIIRVDEQLRRPYLLELSDLWELVPYVHEYCAQAVSVLEEVAATGRGDVYGNNGLQTAWYAAMLGEGELVKSLVRRGADPNLPFVVSLRIPLPDKLTEENSTKETLLCAVVAHGFLYYKAPHLSSSDALELTEWLLENGADWRKCSPKMLSSCVAIGVLVSSGAEDDEVAPAMELAVRMACRMGRLQRHTDVLIRMLMNEKQVSGLPYLRRLTEAGVVRHADLEGENGSMLSKVEVCRPHAEEMLRWLLDEWKLNPNFRPADLQDASKVGWEDYPLTQMLRDLEVPQDAETTARALRCVELLLQRGAKWNGRVWPWNGNPALRELLEKYGFRVEEE